MQVECSLFCVLTVLGLTNVFNFLIDSFSEIHKFDKKPKMYFLILEMTKMNELLNSLQIRNQFCQRAKMASFKP